MAKVFIVDDDRNIVESLSIVLESKGHQVSSSFDNVDVVSKVKKNNPDLIILDVMFPENDSAGFEMARAIKADNATKHIPILMLSAINEKGVYAGTFSNRDRDDSFLPVNEFVEKPINPRDLLNKVDLMLQKVKA